MRFERSYGGVKAILEGEELGNLLDIFQGYRFDKVKRELKTDDPLFTLRAMAYRAYSDLHRGFEVSVETVNTQVTPDSRKAHLFYVVVLYLTVRFLLPDAKWETFFDTHPLEDAAVGPVGGPREDFFRKIAKGIKPQDIVRSALGMEGGAEALFGDNPPDPSRN
jgi:hypothetical protein